jgi:hypothetical protein
MTPNVTAPAALLVSAECPLEQVVVTKVRGFQDPQGAWRVVGVIENRWDQAVSKLVTAVEAIDSVGQVIDHGEDVSAYPLNLEPGAQAPFSAWIKRDFPGLDHFTVSVEACVAAEELERSKVEVRGQRVSVDSTGRAHITAELVNTGRKSVLVNGLMGSVSDAAGMPLSADYAAVTARYLLPGERGPVRVSLDLPPDADGSIEAHGFYMDVVVAEPTRAPFDAQEDLRVTSKYVDTEGRLHLVGEATNHTLQSLTLRLQATLYEDATKSRVVDAASLDTPLPIGPAETRPVDFVDWGAVNAQPGLAADLVQRDAPIALRFEPLQSWSSAARPVRLELAETTPAFTEQDATFAFTFRNHTGNRVAEVLVTGVLRDRKSGRLLATGSAHLRPVQGLAPLDMLEGLVTIPLWSGFDPETVDFEVTALAQ